MNILPVLGAYRILRKRLKETSRPGLTLWTDCGEKAAIELGAVVGSAAHASETYDLEARAEAVALMKGLEDGKIDAADLARLRKLIRLVDRSAELDHKIGEAVRT